MAEFVDVMKKYKKMCESYNYKCGACGMYYKNNPEANGMACQDYMVHYPEGAEKIVTEWVKQHPAKTNAEKFKEIFGFELPLTLQNCPAYTTKCLKDNTPCSDCEYCGFWDQEYKGCGDTDISVRAQWIPVEQGFPDGEEAVLCVDNSGTMFVICLKYADVNISRDVTHWMALPEQPRKEGQKGRDTV